MATVRDSRNQLLLEILSALAGGGAVQWGAVGGDILDQADLQAQFEDTVPTNLKVINSISDFETQDATTITLDPTYLYQIGASLSTSKRFITSGSQVEGLGAASKLTYTGTGSMFTNTNSRFAISSIVLDCPSATVFECIGDNSGNVNHRVNALSIIIANCTKVLTSTNAGAQVFDLIQASNVTGPTAVSFSGTTAALVYNFSRMSFIGLTAGATCFDFGTVLMDELELTNVIALGDATATAISGAANSANVTAGNTAFVQNCNFSALTTPLSGVDVEDIRWEFQSNSGLPNSIDDALEHTSDNVLETTIVTAEVKVKANAVFITDAVGRFEADGTGRLTYIGERPSRLPIDINGTVLAASGGDKQISLCIAINGVPIDATCTKGTASSTKAASLSTIWQYDFVNGDYVEPFVSNDSNDVNIILTQAILRIN
jgi:hypothetical protein